MSDNERAVTLGVLCGFKLGTQGAKSSVSDDLAKLSSEFIEYCVDNLHDRVMASFDKLAK